MGSKNARVEAMNGIAPVLQAAFLVIANRLIAKKFALAITRAMKLQVGVIFVAVSHVAILCCLTTEISNSS